MAFGAAFAGGAGAGAGSVVGVSVFDAAFDWVPRGAFGVDPSCARDADAAGVFGASSTGGDCVAGAGAADSCAGAATAMSFVGSTFVAAFGASIALGASADFGGSATATDSCLVPP